MKEELSHYEKVKVFQAQRQLAREARGRWSEMRDSGFDNLAASWREQYILERCLAKKLANHFALNQEI